MLDGRRSSLGHEDLLGSNGNSLSTLRTFDFGGRCDIGWHGQFCLTRRTTDCNGHECSLAGNGRLFSGFRLLDSAQDDVSLGLAAASGTGLRGLGIVRARRRPGNPCCHAMHPVPWQLQQVTKRLPLQDGQAEWLCQPKPVPLQEQHMLFMCPVPPQLRHVRSVCWAPPISDGKRLEFATPAASTMPKATEATSIELPSQAPQPVLAAVAFVGFRTAAGAARVAVGR